MKRLFSIICFSLFFGVTYSEPPNIVFLLTDDQRWNTLGVMGNEIIQTPNLDNLASEGYVFDNAYVVTSICFASRATIIGGQYQSRNGLNNFGSVFTQAQFNLTYPKLLKSAGYHIGFIGKYGIGGSLAIPQSEFDYWKGFPGQGWYEIKENNVVVDHLTNVMGGQAEEFLDGIPAGKKFCLSVSFKAAHVQDQDLVRPFIPDPKYDSYYVNDSIVDPVTADPNFFNSLPEFLKDPNTEMRRRWVTRFSTPEKFQTNVKNYYRLITGVDSVVGRIRTKLKEIGADTNTVIFFTGDNGFYLSERGYAGKWLAHEHSIRVPMMYYDPRNPLGQAKRISPIALNLDIAPTLLEIAELPIPTGMQGRSLLGLMYGSVNSWRSEFYYEHPWTNGAIPVSEAIIGDQYKYIVYPDNNNYEEFYDYLADPNEINNLIGNTIYQTELNDLKTRFNILKNAAHNLDSIPERESAVFIKRKGLEDNIKIKSRPEFIRIEGVGEFEEIIVYDFLGKTIESYTSDNIGRIEIGTEDFKSKGIVFVKIPAKNWIKKVLIN